MRSPVTPRLRCIALLATLALVAQGADLSPGTAFDGLRFTDGLSRNAQDFGDQLVVLVRFCGQGQATAALLRKEIKSIHDAIEQEHLPARLICTTPDRTPKQLAAYQRELGMTAALFAQDTVNPERISLSNCIQIRALTPRGGEYLSWEDPLGNFRRVYAAAGARHRYPVEGLTSDRGKELWWYVERGQPDALRTLVAGANLAKSPPLQADARRILAVVQARFTERLDAALAAEPGMYAIEALERLLADGDGLDLKAAQQRLQTLLASPALKDELQARTIFRRIDALLADCRAEDRDAIRANYRTLSEKYPDTHYGQRAARMP